MPRRGPRRAGLRPAAALLAGLALAIALATTTTTTAAAAPAPAPASTTTTSTSTSPLPPLAPRRAWQAPEYLPPFDKRSPRSFLRFFFGPFLQNLHVTGPDSLWPTKVSHAGAALREAGLAPRVAGGTAGPKVVGASQTYDDFISGFVAWVEANVPGYPQPPPQLRSGDLMPPLLPQYADDVAYVRSLTRGAFPDVVRGRPEALSPRETDPLQNGVEGRLAPGFAFTAPGNQEKGAAWRQWEALEAAKRAKKRGLARLFSGAGGGGKKGVAGEAAAAGTTTGDNDRGAPWLRVLVARFDDPADEL